ncbi:hypothetical protein RQP46_008118 [Phenoliferia psychrophenolica]
MDPPDRIWELVYTMRHQWGDDVELREQMLQPRLTEIDSFYITMWRARVKRLEPDLYQKYGPLLLEWDMDEPEFQRADARIQADFVGRNPTYTEEHALSNPTRFLGPDAIIAFHAAADSELLRAAYSAMEALSASPKHQGSILVLHVKWNQAETDPSIAFELCGAELLTDAEVRDLFRNDDDVFESLGRLYRPIELPSADDQGRPYEWIGTGRYLLTDAATTLRNPKSFDGRPLYFPHQVHFHKMSEETCSPPEQRAMTDPDWLATLKRVLGKSAQVKTRGKFGHMVSLRQKERQYVQ